MPRTISKELLKINQKRRREKISNAIAAYRLYEKGWSKGDLMNHFDVCARTIERWFNFLERDVGAMEKPVKDLADE